jgi:hypothetical protein
MSAWKPKGTFDHYWFANLTAKLWERYVLPRKKSIAHYLEVGVCEGQSMLWVLEHLLWDKPHGRGVGVDVFTPARNWHHGEGDEHLTRATDNISLQYGTTFTPYGSDAHGLGTRGFAWNAYNADKTKPACEIYKADSRDFMRLESRDFDMVFIDGGHDANVALPDIVNGFRLLREGGLFVIDDVERRWRGGRAQVRIAMQAFEHCYDGFFDVLYSHPKQICYVKCKRRRRGKWPPTLESGPVIAPSGPTGGED